MIKRKFKKCKSCSRFCPIWSRGRCKYCATKEDKKPKKPRKPINKVSTKKRTELNIYTQKRAEFLKLHPVCAGNGIIPGCNYDKLLTIHHLCGREGNNMLDEDNWMTLCMHCHMFVHDNDSWSRENGFLKSKHQI